MKKYQIYLLLILSSLAWSCKSNKGDEFIDESKLGFIDASVKSEETNLKAKAEFENIKPGEAEKIARSFENAPPMIPHTTRGFFPIKMNNNICFTCHLPDKIEESGAVAMPESHFIDLRPKMVEVDGVLQFEDESKVHIEEMDEPVHAYFNCSQCHAPQANISADIENLFTPEFREEFGIEKSSLKDKINEGI
jgi:nitrate reductase (cytochrome), electron transfer subunit